MLRALRVEVDAVAGDLARDLAGDLALALPFAGAAAAAEFLVGIVVWITLRSLVLVRLRELGLAG